MSSINGCCQPLPTMKEVFTVPLFLVLLFPFPSLISSVVFWIEAMFFRVFLLFSLLTTFYLPFQLGIFVPQTIHLLGYFTKQTLTTFPTSLSFFEKVASLLSSSHRAPYRHHTILSSYIYWPHGGCQNVLARLNIPCKISFNFSPSVLQTLTSHV